MPLTHILHFFYAIVGNYGLAIIMLTVLVRGCMFPLSLKQAAGAQKMQMIQPEMKKLQEKHKNDSAGPRQGPAGVVPQAQLQSAERLPADLHSDAGLHRAVPLADGRHRAARRPAVHALDSLVLESGRPRHAVRLERLHAAVVQRAASASSRWGRTSISCRSWPSC